MMYLADGLRTAIVAPDNSDGALALRMTIELAGTETSPPDSIAFLFTLPTGRGGAAKSLIELVAELERSCVEVLRLEAIEAGRSKMEAERMARTFARRARIEGRRQAEAEAAEMAAAVPTCQFCSRRVALIEDGVRLCSRHADELGVRPKGKI